MTENGEMRKDVKLHGGEQVDRLANRNVKESHFGQNWNETKILAIITPRGFASGI
jgi:hypothetical protein